MILMSMYVVSQTTVFNPPLRLHLPKSTNFHIIQGDSSVGAKVFGDSVCIVEISAYETHRVKGVPQKMWLVDFHGGKYYVLNRNAQKSFTKGKKLEPKKTKVKQTQSDAVQYMVQRSPANNVHE